MSQINIFSGSTYSSPEEKKRLAGQRERVFEVMKNGKWWSLPQIRMEIMSVFGKMDSEAAISARIRDFRKDKWSAFFRVSSVESKVKSGSTWVYRLNVQSRAYEA